MICEQDTCHPPVATGDAGRLPGKTCVGPWRAAGPYNESKRASIAESTGGRDDAYRQHAKPRAPRKVRIVSSHRPDRHHTVLEESDCAGHADPSQPLAFSIMIFGSAADREWQLII